MIVTEITEVSKARCRVVIDHEIAFVLYKGDLRICHIKQGEQLADEIYRSLMQEILPKRAKLRCMNLLKSRDYTEAELTRKLHAGGYPKCVIQEAIAYVKSYGYIGDRAYAEKYMDTYAEERSYRRIEQELIRKGIPKEVIAQIHQERIENEEDPEPAQIRKILLKKGYSEQTMTREEKMKIFGYLVRKGYSIDKIKRCMNCEMDE